MLLSNANRKEAQRNQLGIYDGVRARIFDADSVRGTVRTTYSSPVQPQT